MTATIPHNKIASASTSFLKTIGILSAEPEGMQFDFTDSLCPGGSLSK